MSTPVRIVAVSGGIDSVVLLDTLAGSDSPLIVAHVDHGIRSTSDEDERFVRELANRYNLPYESVKLSLGPGTDEDTARQARYAWLEQVMQAHGAKRIVTAHHEDDVIETMIINLLRGTGWRGLCSLRSTERRERPLITWSKADIVAYALDHGLTWRDDETNDSFRYLRNRVRHQLIAGLKPAARASFLELYHQQCQVRKDIESELAKHPGSNGAISRNLVNMADEQCAVELLRHWLGTGLELRRLRDLLLFSKVAKPGSKWSLASDRFVTATSRTLIVQSPRD